MINDLQIELIDEKIKDLKKIQPRDGWINLCRNLLGMTRTQLAKKMGVSPQRISRIEACEVDGKLKVETLLKAAEALECDLHYCFVPQKKSFKKILDSKIKSRVFSEIEKTQHSMALEGQALSKLDLERQARIMEMELRFRNKKELWND